MPLFQDPSVEYHAVCSPTGAIMTAAGSGPHAGFEDVTSATSPARIFENLRGPKGQSSPKQPEQLMKRYQENVDGTALVIFPTAFLGRSSIQNVRTWKWLEKLLR